MRTTRSAVCSGSAKREKVGPKMKRSTVMVNHAPTPSVTRARRVGRLPGCSAGSLNQALIPDISTSLRGVVSISASRVKKSAAMSDFLQASKDVASTNRVIRRYDCSPAFGRKTVTPRWPGNFNAASIVSVRTASNSAIRSGFGWRRMKTVTVPPASETMSPASIGSSDVDIARCDVPLTSVLCG